MKIKAVFLLFLLLGCGFVRGQEGPEVEYLTIVPLGVDKGLRQSMVSSVVQDHNGLIWMTTGDGLHYYDGSEFKAFRVPVNTLYSHSDNLLRGMVEGKSGTLTLSSSSSLLNFNTASGSFSIAYRKEGSHPSLLGELIDHLPAAWINQRELFLVGNNGVTKVNLVFEGSVPFPEKFNPDVTLKGAANELLISGSEGILLLDMNRNNAGSALRAKWLPIEGLQSISQDKSGQIFILVNSKIFRYYPTGKMTLLAEIPVTEKLDLFIDSWNNFWLTNKFQGRQFCLTQGKLKEVKFSYQEGKRVDSLSPGIMSVYEDKYQNIWFGTDNDGVLVYSPDQVRFLRSDVGFTRCLAWFNNQVWAGTYNEGVWRIHPDLSKATRVHLPGDQNNVYYLDMLTDNRGRLWIASRKGLTVVDQNGVPHYTHSFDCTNAKLFLANDSMTVYCNGFSISYSAGEKISEGHKSNFVAINAFLFEAETAWLGTPFGLYRMPRFLPADQRFSAKYQVSRNPIYSLVIHEGKIWAATGNGIEIFEMTGEKAPLPGRVKELENEVIYSLVPDEKGRIWFTGNRGIGCINKAKDQFLHFSLQDNLQSLEFNYNAACKIPDGRLYFGGIKGVNGFEPAWFDEDVKAPAIRMVSLFVSDSSHNPGVAPAYADVELLRKAPHIGGKLYCPDYTNAASHLFSFYLEGYQQGWSKPSRNASFEYRDLPPGKYKLFAKCAEAWQNWSEPVLLLSVTVRPPFWKTIEFFIVLIIIVIVLTTLLVRKINSIRYSRRILALEQQNAVEKERLRISKDMHDEIGASLTRISILSEIAKNQNNDREAELKVINQISGIAGGVVDEMREIIWAMNPKNDTLDSFTSYFRQYASSYLETANIESSFSIPDTLDSNPMSSELRRNLFLTLKEALHNIVKHSGATRVEIVLEKHREELLIRITENGKGFDPHAPGRTGNGLPNMRRRVEECHGIFTIESAPGEGSKLEITVTLSDRDRIERK